MKQPRKKRKGGGNERHVGRASRIVTRGKSNLLEQQLDPSGHVNIYHNGPFVAASANKQCVRYCTLVRTCVLAVAFALAVDQERRAYRIINESLFHSAVYLLGSVSTMPLRVHILGNL